MKLEPGPHTPARLVQHATVSCLITDQAGATLAIMRRDDGGPLAAEIVRRYNEHAELRATVARLTEQLQRLGVGVTRDTMSAREDYEISVDDWPVGETRMGIRFDGPQEGLPGEPLAVFTDTCKPSLTHGDTFTIPASKVSHTAIIQALAACRARRTAAGNGNGNGGNGK